MDNESGDSIEPMEKVPLKKTGRGKIKDISAWLREGSRELIPETRGSALLSLKRRN